MNPSVVSTIGLGTLGVGGEIPSSGSLKHNAALTVTLFTLNIVRKTKHSSVDPNQSALFQKWSDQALLFVSLEQYCRHTVNPLYNSSVCINIYEYVN